MAKKRHTPAFRKLEGRIEAEGNKQCQLAYGAAAIALHRHCGLEKDGILKVFDATQEIWNDVASDNAKSMLMVCEQETGIEVQNGSGKSWEDVAFLNGQSAQMIFTPAKLAYMRRQQVAWVAASVIAGILIALYREYDFDADMCARFYGQVKKIQEGHGMDPQRITDAAMRETGVDVSDVAARKPQD